MLLAGIPIVAGPRAVHATRDEHDGTITLQASHDGYATEYALVHHRAVRLAADGRALDGEDSFTDAEGHDPAGTTSDDYAVRFHLHPSIKASRLSDGRGVILLMPDKEVWTFATLVDAVLFEECVFFFFCVGL